jgi:hypothetical protein
MADASDRRRDRHPQRVAAAPLGTVGSAPPNASASRPRTNPDWRSRRWRIC